MVRRRGRGAPAGRRRTVSPARCLAVAVPTAKEGGARKNSPGRGARRRRRQAWRHARLAYALYLGIGELRRADPDGDRTGEDSTPSCRRPSTPWCQRRIGRYPGSHRGLLGSAVKVARASPVPGWCAPPGSTACCYQSGRLPRPPGPPKQDQRLRRHTTRQPQPSPTGLHPPRRHLTALRTGRLHPPTTIRSLWSVAALVAILSEALYLHRKG